MNALVIDDSRAMRAIIGKIMRQLGYQVAEAEHGAAGLEALERMPAATVVLVDWNMPVMDGLAFVESVRAQPRWADLPIVMVTTEAESSRIEKALAAGASEYVMKPFTAEVLKEKLALLGLTDATHGDEDPHVARA